MTLDSENIETVEVLKRVPSISNLGILFCCFLFVSSDVFNDNILSIIDGTLSGTHLTFFGAILQGIALILIYSVLVLYI